jgi:hypothetical protein
MSITFEKGFFISQNVRLQVITPTTTHPSQSLVTIATYLRNYMAEFRNPSFYAYRLDGNGYYIDDGGSDMWDNPGNVTTPWLKNNVQRTAGTTAWSLGTYPSSSNYLQTGSVGTIDGDFQYISLGYTQYSTSPATQSIQYHPLTLIGTRVGSGSVGYQTSGNSGADGGGTLSSGSIYSGSLVSGFTTHAFYRQTSNASTDPSHCSVYILLGHTNWGSTFGTVKTYAEPTSAGGAGGYLHSSGSQSSNLFTACILLSKANGVAVASSEVKTVVDNFVYRVGLSLGY